MKPVGESFGFGTLITVFLPGLALALGVVIVLQNDPEWRASQDTILDVFSNMKEWQQTFASLAIISLLGSLIAAFNGLLESLVYDRITRSKLGLTPDVYNNQWYEYLYRLSKENNSYITRVVTWFLFESRMAVAVAGVLLFYVIESPDRQFCTLIWFILAIVGLGVLGYHHHNELAEYRKYWFGQWTALRTNSMTPRTEERDGLR